MTESARSPQVALVAAGTAGVGATSAVVAGLLVDPMANGSRSRSAASARLGLNATSLEVLGDGTAAAIH
jgi:hypothetical protein